MSLWFASHGDDVGMTSSCSHCIHIALMTSSDLDIVVIGTRMNQDSLHDRWNRPFAHDVSIVVDNRQTYMRPKSLIATGRPSCMTYRPCETTGRLIRNLGALGISSQYVYVILMYSDMF